jgi:nitrate/nitrite transport system substrate-binding protein
MWFLTQINRIDLYQQAAAQLNMVVPADEMRGSRWMNGTVWAGKYTQGYAASFKVQV